MKKRPPVKTACACCGKELLISYDRHERCVSGKFFCGVACRSKGMTKAMGLVGHARKTKARGLGATKLRPCLGWCGKMIKTTKYVRFCDSCTSRKNFASAGIDEFDYMGGRASSDSYVTDESREFFI